ncbi:MAG: beta-N-acetylglucosaminidase domain-containing protein [Victivallaceae bacterium]|nr:beta-N-acetylglucosaminidase domain-containing protein [Victivallaceae bacterium]
MNPAMKKVIATAVTLTTLSVQAQFGTVFPTPQKSTPSEVSSFPPSTENTKIFFHPTQENIAANRIPTAGKLGADFYLKALRNLKNVQDAAPVEIHAGLLSAPAMAEFFKDGIPSLPAQGYAIRVQKSDDGKIIVALGGADPRGLFYAFASLRQLLDETGAVPVQNLENIDDFPVWRERYICDYFANISPDQFIDTAADKVGGIAGLIEANWRNPEWWKSVEPLLAKMKKYDSAGMFDFMAHLHLYSTPPDGPKFNAANEEDIQQFIAVCRKLAESGVSIFMIAADDTTPRGKEGFVCYHDAEKTKFNGSVGRAHGYVMKRLYDALHTDFPNLRFSMVAAPYSLGHGIGQPEVDKYVTDWAAEAPDEVMWVWTGDGVFSPELRKTDHQVMEKLLGNHKMYLFDNSNGLLSPLPRWETVFYPEMKDDDCGIVFLLSLYFGSRPWETIYLIGANAYLWNPAAYNPETAWNYALREKYGESAVAPVNRMRKVMATAQMKIKTNDPSDIAATLKEFEAAFAGLPANVPRGDIEWQLTGLREFAAFQPPEVDVPELQNTVKLDGVIDPEEWKGSAEIAMTDRDGSNDTTPTTLRLFQSDGALYLAFDIPADKPLPTPVPMNFDGSVYLNPEVLELFIQFAPTVAPNQAADYAGSYAHFALDSANQRFDEDSGTGGFMWDGDWQSAVAETGNGWSAEVVVRPTNLRDSDATPAKNGNRWRANFHRINNRTGKIQSWSHSSGGFHQPNYFGTLNFN